MYGREMGVSVCMRERDRGECVYERERGGEEKGMRRMRRGARLHDMRRRREAEAETEAEAEAEAVA